MKSSKRQKEIKNEKNKFKVKRFLLLFFFKFILIIFLFLYKNSLISKSKSLLGCREIFSPQSKSYWIQWIYMEFPISIKIFLEVQKSSSHCQPALTLPYPKNPTYKYCVLEEVCAPLPYKYCLLERRFVHLSYKDI